MEKIFKVRSGIMGVMLALSIFLVAESANTAVAGCLADDGSGVVFNCGDVVTRDCTLEGYMDCSGSRYGLIIGPLVPGGDVDGNGGVTINGAGFTLDGGGTDGRHCEVNVGPEELEDRLWCIGHPCRQADVMPNDDDPATFDGVLDSGIVNANTVSPGNSCNPRAPIGQGGCDNLWVKNLEITGFCDGIWISGDCEPRERRLTGLLIEGNFIHDNGKDGCGNYTPCSEGDGGDWEYRYYNDAIFTAQIGMDENNNPDGWPCPECMKDKLEFPDLVQDGENCVCQSEDRNIIRHNKLYNQSGCTCVSCPGGNGINLQGGLEIEAVLWSGCNEIEKNVCENNSASGIHYTHATTYNRIHGNYLAGNGLGGIANGCGWCSGSYIYDNVAKENYGLGIGVSAMAKIKNNITIDTMAILNPEYAELGYGPLPGHGIMTVAPCHPLAAADGICASGEGSELVGNTSVGNDGKDIVDMFDDGSKAHVAKAWGYENMCQTTSGVWYYGGDTPPGPNGLCQYDGGARLHCTGDMSHDCLVGFPDAAILNGQWMWGNPGHTECCPSPW